MNRTEAIQVLGISSTTEASVRTAFRELSKRCHPDGPTPNPALWQAITEAKDVLLAPPPRCPACMGTGRKKLGAIFTFCTECGGKGHG